jgi:hypothetical protein
MVTKLDGEEDTQTSATKEALCPMKMALSN